MLALELSDERLALRQRRYRGKQHLVVARVMHSIRHFAESSISTVH
jgi:hypothetical protein